MISRLSRLLLLLAFCTAKAFAQDTASAGSEADLAATLAYLDSADKSMPYQTGAVKLHEFATLQVPQDYKFLPETQAQWLIQKVWGNPEDKDVMGLLVRKDFKISDPGAWAFIVSYDASGYVKDGDAKDINYDDMLKEIQAGEAEANKQRTAAGFSTMHLVAWASKPFYDADNKVLHWAKELQFGGSPEPTLNYDVRILGRKGVLSMNAVGNMNQLSDIKAHIPDILHAATFADGFRYKDFDPGIDKVAAYTIGGLVAGKLLAKAGLLALLLKNIKLVLIAVLGGFGAFRKRIAKLFNRRRDDGGDYAPNGDVALLPATADAGTPPHSTPITGSDA